MSVEQLRSVESHIRDRSQINIRSILYIADVLPAVGQIKSLCDAHSTDLGPDSESRICPDSVPTFEMCGLGNWVICCIWKN